MNGSVVVSKISLLNQSFEVEVIGVVLVVGNDFKWKFELNWGKVLLKAGMKEFKLVVITGGNAVVEDGVGNGVVNGAFVVVVVEDVVVVVVVVVVGSVVLIVVG